MPAFKDLSFPDKAANLVADIASAWNEEVRSEWKELFDSALHALLDYETPPSKFESVVQNASAIADLALDALETRFPRVGN